MCHPPSPSKRPFEGMGGVALDSTEEVIWVDLLLGQLLEKKNAI